MAELPLIHQKGHTMPINSAPTCDDFHKPSPTLEQMSTWTSDYKEFIATYNAILELEGLPLQTWKNF